MFDIEKCDEEILTTKKETFKRYIEHKIEKVAVENLHNLAKKHSKSKYALSQSNKLEQQKYLKDRRFSKAESQFPGPSHIRQRHGTRSC